MEKKYEVRFSNVASSFQFQSEAERAASVVAKAMRIRTEVVEVGGPCGDAVVATFNPCGYRDD